MSEAIELAGHALKTSPNPQVGAVLCVGTEIFATGFHQAAGCPHAEIEVFNQLKEIPKNATLYVTLEPCCHIDKQTAPCSDAILKSGIKKVVVGCLDPNPAVQGKGVRLLRKNGLLVEVGCLKEQCEDLIRPFQKWITQKKPYLILKSAMTLDGKIADSQGNSKWISSKESRKKVHELRAKADAIMVGAGTVKADDPLLTVREVKGENPLRIIIDPNLSLNSSYQVFQSAKETPTLLVIHENLKDKKKLKSFRQMGVEILFCKFKKEKMDWQNLMQQLTSKNITQILVEGGAALSSSLLEIGFVDELQLFIAVKILGGLGLQLFQNFEKKKLSEACSFQLVEQESVGGDLWMKLYPLIPKNEA
ncbi:MAG: bifunctional diaminohydroxyphosphoribosylaminopyrimidine deaminase/5-amino-6-(5-phosphoribosylamino)uracil reductase RibD [Deltaproteobacteria bacterium]|nr:bifunctional diaminohydroxyphosphoribosylaminopyrimidine deaminase/5-amino-6-(5-phosphoribosylamino)uracil reductase RibD [Deltaproteobacteria bacterium]